MPNYAERITEEANALAGAVRLANATTGAEDTGIVDAVATLIAGYGGGGTPDWIDKISVNDVTLDRTIAYNTTDFYFEHNLGVVPDVIIVKRTHVDDLSITQNQGTKILVYFGGLLSGDEKRIYSIAQNETVLLASNASILDETKFYYQPYRNDVRLFVGSAYKVIAFTFKNGII